MKKTPWFDGDVKPARVGVYEREYSIGTSPFSYWNGKLWCLSGKTPRLARGWDGFASLYQDRRWRGLAEKPKKRGAK